MKKKTLLRIAIVASLILVIVTAINVNRNIDFFRDTDILSADEFSALLPSPDALVYTAQHESDDFFVELMAYRADPPRVVDDLELEGFQFLWRVEPRGRARLHRYEFRLMPLINLGWVLDGASHMFVHYGDNIIQRPLWVAFGIEPVRFPSRYWNGIWPTRSKADSVLIWADGYSLTYPSDLENKRITAQLDIYRRRRPVLSLDYEWRGFNTMEQEVYGDIAP